MASKTTRTTDTAEIWQWNCRSFQKRAAALQSYLDAAITQPDFICLQEVGKGAAKLGDYYTLQNPLYPRVATLMHKAIAASDIYYPQYSTEHQLIELNTTKRGKTKTFIGNVYSLPKERPAAFLEMLEWALGHLGKK